MTVRLYMFLAHGVAVSTAAHRSGARHILMLYATGSDLAAARELALADASKRGWSFLIIRREQEVDFDHRLLADEALRAKASEAVRKGCAMIIYDELPLDD